ncbi:hypothetical protein OAJ50_03045 [Candidatus Nitrosopelagicus sp.]|nr:hypothetical protein [Candidatus Nitrosopelagicus sp.]
MKMIISGAVLLLMFSILSFGMPTFVNAQSTEFPLTVSTDYPGYAENGEIIISGQVKESSLSEYTTPVTLMVVSPDGNIVKIDQLVLNSNNEFSTTLVAGGPLWKAGGDYTVKANYGAQKAETTFNYAGGSGSITTPPPTPEPTPEPEPVIEVPEPVIEVPEPIAIVEPEPEPEPEPQALCGEGTVMKDGKCVAEQKEGGGCLIATAAFGSEMAPQVQFLREIRDNTVMTTQSGTAFMTGFNQFYYSFSPAVADYERENPVFKEVVKVTLTPMLTSLTLLNYVEVDTEEEMLGYGISIILLNIGMYFVAPAAAIIAIKNRLNRN